MSFFKALVRTIGLTAFAFSLGIAQAADAPRVKFETTVGNFTLELYPEKAPKTVANFLKYVEDKHYDGTIFHRVIPGFMAQGGGFTKDMQQKPTRVAVENEARNGLRNVPGSVAMARTPDPHSATSQFFINFSDNRFLNFTAETTQGWGYTVFGKVVEGMDVVNKMASIPTGVAGGMSDVPTTPIVITSARLVAPAAAPAAPTPAAK
ncbi:peptidylprolyl isomerase [Uliginosibacterium sp. H3]|uniref:Peptidyl-prolyl cis-trans isomerase n=1 Tax=Uliginosibacterium silvisoli TaxID=3114758 RepID=A0ABU6K8Z4_9RHOO|nr:peptidylprolyl isomerase [Uliginosibacterium sp. H3]